MTSAAAAALVHNALLLAEAEAKSRRARDELAVAAVIHEHVARFRAPKEVEDDCTVVDVRYTGVGA
jgi:hypothetical protein